MEEVYVHSCQKSIGRNFHSLNIRISSRQNKEWLLNFVIRVIWYDSIRVILKSDKRAARVRFEITISMSDQNCKRNEKAFTSLFLPEREMMQYKAKMVRLKTEMTQFRGT